MNAARWPHLVFSDSGLERLAEVEAFLDELDDQAADKVRAELHERLGYLDAYGGQISDTDSRRRFRVHLNRGWAPLSFGLVWEVLDLEPGEYRYCMNGGLIWHGGSNDPLCVSLTPQCWGIHT